MEISSVCFHHNTTPNFRNFHNVYHRNGHKSSREKNRMKYITKKMSVNKFPYLYCKWKLLCEYFINFVWNGFSNNLFFVLLPLPPPLFLLLLKMPLFFLEPCKIYTKPIIAELFWILRFNIHSSNSGSSSLPSSSDISK